jgi:photosystem II stability/assembly factor-like uncharacterized protein
MVMRRCFGLGWAGLLVLLVSACGSSGDGGGDDSAANGASGDTGVSGAANGESTSTSGGNGENGTGGQNGTGGESVVTGGGNGGPGQAGSGQAGSGHGGSGQAGSTNHGGNGGSSNAGGAGGSDAGAPMPTGPLMLVPGQWTNISPPELYRPHASAPPYGCMDIQLQPDNASTLYLTTDIEGMWKSTDMGATWKQIGNLPSPVSPGVIAIDPTAPANMYYIGGVRGASVGFWVSKDGGDTWTEPDGFKAKADNSADGWSNDLYDVKADPADFKHVIVTFHAPWAFTNPAGVLESKDGGASWTRRMPGSNWGSGHSIWFLGNSTTWLLGAQYGGYWRTTDSGVTWKQVSTVNMQHGGTSSFVSSSGVLYVGALSNLLRSTDNGQTFETVAPHTSDGYYAVVGDGNFLYTQLGNTGGNGTGKDQSYIVSPEGDGKTWTTYNDQTFADGPYRMTFDAKNRIIYSANWNAGVWALKVK